MIRGESDRRSSGEDASSTGPRGPRQERRVRAWIGASVVIQGGVTSSEDMTIAGRVEGDVTVRENQLTIAPHARIEGDIIAGAVVIHGSVTGNVTAEQTIEVGENGSVMGDLVAPRMTVAEGASLHGRAEIRRGEPVPA
ncbi:MAG TPA: polymer-forming cytoskeletal protein [Longimicrobiales bacterium]|nr:polymer-forming cytoskeletal protein [Longimicrobiales bacterium]